MKHRVHQRNRQRWAISLLVSMMVHVTVVAGITVGGPFINWPGTPATAPRDQVVLQCPRIEDEQRPDRVPAILLDLGDEQIDAVTISPEEMFAAAMTLSEPELAQSYPPLDHSPLTDMRELVTAAAEEASHWEEEKQFDRLEKLAGRLQHISNEDSMDQLVGNLSNVLGTDARAPAPADEPVAGQFDFGTAQLYDVRKQVGPDSRVQYISILIDAEGRQMTAPLDEAEGARAFRVMQLLRQNPLAQRVYRNLVMSLMDKILQTRSGTETNGGAGAAPVASPESDGQGLPSPDESRIIHRRTE